MLLFGESGNDLPKTGQDVLTDNDQLLIAALQDRPRAPWHQIGSAMDVSASSAARHWGRLRDEGHAWLSAYPARIVANTGYCWIAAERAQQRDVAAALAAHASTYWIEQLDGARSFFVAIAAPSLRRLAEVADELTALPGVAGAELQTSRAVLHDGSIWQPRLAGPVDQEHPAVWRADAPEAMAAPSDADLSLYAALMRDGRTAYTELADVTGLSERTLRRRLPGMLQAGILSTRCDVSREAVGMPAGVFLSVRWTSRWATLVGVANRIPGARLVAGASGSAPFLLHFWVRSVAETDRMIATLQAAVPELEIERIDFAVRTLKRFGRMFGPDGRVAGEMSLAALVAFFVAATRG